MQFVTVVPAVSKSSFADVKRLHMGCWFLLGVSVCSRIFSHEWGCISQRLLVGRMFIAVTTLF